MTLKEKARLIAINRLMVPDEIATQTLKEIASLSDKEIEYEYEQIKAQRVANFEEQKKRIQAQIDALA